MEWIGGHGGSSASKPSRRFCNKDPLESDKAFDGTFNRGRRSCARQSPSSRVKMKPVTSVLGRKVVKKAVDLLGLGLSMPQF